MDFKAAMFDFDGTVTPEGVHYPDREMVDALVRLAGLVPVAFCTGRQLESFLEHAGNDLVSGLGGNLYLIAENGSVGYYFNVESGKFKEFYRVDWPSSFIDREELMKKLNTAVQEYGEVYYDAHRVIIVLRTKQSNIPFEKRDIKVINQLSAKIYEVVKKFLHDIDPEYENFIHVGNSGIGVVLCPANGDKDNGILEFGRYLSKNRGISFGSEFREIMVVGDRPEEGGNDHLFLKGKYGTPFTVGAMIEGSEFPKPVFDANGQRLLHDKGTLRLIGSIVG